MNAPDNQRLTAPTIASRKQARDIGCVLIMLCLKVASLIKFQILSFDNVLLGPEETHR
jgi:hypothetical protein